MSLETRHYVATLEDVAEITRTVFAAQSQNSEGRATFLRSIVATTQAELNATPRKRAPASPVKLSAEETAEQLAALESVGARFLKIVTKTARELITGADPGGLILNKRTNFARSSLSVIRKWVRAGHDITSLVASRVTKAALYVRGRRKGPSVKVLGNQTKRFGTRLERTLAVFAATDREAATAQWERLRAQLDAVFRAGGARRHTRQAPAPLRAAA